MLNLNLFKTLAIAYFIVSLPFISQAQSAGGQGSGGGDVVLCKSNSMLGFLEKRKVYLADTFHLRTRGMLENIKEIDEEKLMDQALKILKDSDPEETLRKKLGDLKFTPLDFLEELDDDNIDTSKFSQEANLNCIKKQLAVQNLKTSEVRYVNSLYQQLPPIERALFRIHEAKIALQKTPNVNDTTFIRNEVEGFARDNFASADTQTPALEKILQHSFCTDYIPKEFFQTRSDGSIRDFGRGVNLNFNRLGSSLFNWTLTAKLITSLQPSVSSEKEKIEYNEQAIKRGICRLAHYVKFRSILGTPDDAKGSASLGEYNYILETSFRAGLMYLNKQMSEKDFLEITSVWWAEASARSTKFAQNDLAFW